MDALLNINSQVLAYADATTSSNPSLKYVDWRRSLSGIVVKNPKTESYVVDPVSSKLIFDGTRSTSIDGTTQFSLALSTIAGTTDRYRFTSTAGTSPAFRTDRALTNNGQTLTWVLQTNQSVTVASDVVGAFAAVQVGDTVFVPGTTTGDSATVFNTANEGFWVVLAKDGPGTTIQLVRPVGTDFSGASEATTCTANTQFQAYSSSGVQVGDKVDISAGFATSVLKTYEVIMVTPKIIEVKSSLALPAQTGIIPTASGMVFYSAAKRYLRVEVDQECAIRLNGDSGNTVRMSPFSAGDSTQVAFFEKVGPSWSLTVVNRSQSPCNVTVIGAE